MRNRYTKELLTEAVKGEITWAGVCRKLGVKPFTGAQYHLRNRAKELEVDTSHFLGQGHRKGAKVERKPIELYLVKDSSAKSHDLKLRLIEEGFKKHECEVCKRKTWMGEPIPLELDHMNSDHWDNRLENLQIVCPNCHTQETRKRRLEP